MTDAARQSEGCRHKRRGLQEATPREFFLHGLLPVKKISAITEKILRLSSACVRQCCLSIRMRKSALPSSADPPVVSDKACPSR
jgi:hypothetical protein